MTSAPHDRRQAPPSKSGELFLRANEHWEEGRLRSAFRVFLAAAKAGNGLACEIVAYFFSDGIGTRANKKAALYWYKRAHRRGSAIAANNIGAILRDNKELSRALRWFGRAAKAGDGEANLNIAKIYLYEKSDLTRAIHYLNQARQTAATGAAREEARSLLKRIAGEKPRPLPKGRQLGMRKMKKGSMRSANRS